MKENTSEHVKNPAAQALGRLGKGKPKRITPQESIARAARAQHARLCLSLKKHTDGCVKEVA